MIKIYLLDFSGAEAENFPTSALPEFILQTKNASLRKERFFSYLLLSHAYRENSRGEMPSIEKDGCGKPKFAGGVMDFSISHTENMVAVIISDEGEVGIDIQKVTSEVSDRLIEKVEKSYAQIKCADKKAELIFLRARGGELLADVLPKDNAEHSVFFRKWTEREALSKADGRGLSLIGRINAEDFLIVGGGFLEANGEGYSFSAVKKK